MLLFEGSFSLSQKFLIYLFFACHPFLIQLIIRAHIVHLSSFKSFIIVEYLMLVDGGFHNSLLQVDSIPSTSYHFLWNRILESIWVSWDLQSPVVGYLAIDSFGNTSMSHDWWILSSVRPQHIYSHLLDCTLYLDSHYHYRWDISCLLMVYINDQ